MVVLAESNTNSSNRRNRVGRLNISTGIECRDKTSVIGFVSLRSRVDNFPAVALVYL